MCGLAGFLQSAGVDRAEAYYTAGRMARTIVHRGPDDGGVWVDSENGIALAHRRLAIVDLSPAGHQPMHSPSGRYVVVFNGEIYNHLSLRDCLFNVAWRGHSDTETLLAAFDRWGIETTLKECVGMFAIVLWDREACCLTLARDRFGEKPLYYGWQNGVFLFGSELKALRAHPAFGADIDRNALTLQLRHNYIPAPYSIYQGIHKLPIGTWLRVDARAKSFQTEPRAYWSFREIAERGQSTPFIGSDTEAVEALETRLHEAVAKQMVADVPLGAFLSGGVDSSTVVALMQSQSNRPVKSFSIGFHETGYNEAEHAKAVARHLGTEHTEYYVTPQEAMAVIPRLSEIFDEPFSDSSQIPTLLVAQMARQHVAVALSGDAGDELFGGYNRYTAAMSLAQKIIWMPLRLRNLLAWVLTTIPARFWDGLGYAAGMGTFSEKARKMAEIVGSRNYESLYRQLVSHWKLPEQVVIGATEPATVLTKPESWLEFSDFEHRMMYLDIVNYLPDGILTKVDRAAMAVSLETRVPLLDHRVVEFAWRLPLSLKIRNGQGKWILRQVLYKYVPKELVERPKMGFGVPIDSWLKGPLREWTEELLDESRLRREGFYNPEPIRRKWKEHLAGRRNWQYYLWDVLMFQSWQEHWHK